MLEVLRESLEGPLALVGWIAACCLIYGAAVGLKSLIIFMRSFPQTRKR